MILNGAAASKAALMSEAGKRCDDEAHALAGRFPLREMRRDPRDAYRLRRRFEHAHDFHSFRQFFAGREFALHLAQIVLEEKRAVASITSLTYANLL